MQAVPRSQLEDYEYVHERIPKLYKFLDEVIPRHHVIVTRSGNRAIVALVVSILCGTEISTFQVGDVITSSRFVTWQTLRHLLANLFRFSIPA